MYRDFMALFIIVFVIGSSHWRPRRVRFREWSMINREPSSRRSRDRFRVEAYNVLTTSSSAIRRCRSRSWRVQPRQAVLRRLARRPSVKSGAQQKTPRVLQMALRFTF